jgi:hypothetical protein
METETRTLFLIEPLVAVTVIVPDSAVATELPVPLEPVDPLELPPPQLTAPSINNIIAVPPQT